MSRFTRRVLAFLLGIVFAFVLIAGGIVGGGYWAFKNLSLNSVGAGESLGDLGSLTFEEWAAFIVDIKKDPQGFTVKELEKKGLNVNSFLTSLGVDVENADERDIDSFRNLAIGALFGDNAAYEIGMGVLFLFLPKNAETGRYPIFSDGARNRLRQYTLGDLMTKGSTNSGFSSIMRSLKLGSVLTSSFDESLSGDGTYLYSSTDRGLNLIANIEIGVLTDTTEGGEKTDFGYMVKEGYLSSLQDKELAEIFASFGSSDDETYQGKYDTLSMIHGITLGELFTYNETEGKYQFNAEPLLNLLTLGSLMGIEVCTEDAECPVHDEVSSCDGEVYEKGELSTKAELEKIMLKNLSCMNVLDLAMGGLDLQEVVDGIDFGLAMGYTKCTGDENCPVHEEATACEGNKDKWYDEEGAYVGKMLNDIANVTLTDAMNGEFDVDGILNDCKIGDVFNYTKTGDVWYDEEGNPIAKETVTEKIMYQLYDKTLNDFDTITVDELMTGITLGEFLGLELDGTTWVDKETREPASVLYQNIADIELPELLEDGNIITTKLSALYVGDFMGYVLKSDGWYDKAGTTPLTGVDKMMAEISLGDVLNETLSLDVNSLKLEDLIDPTGNKVLEFLCSGGTTIDGLDAKLDEMVLGDVVDTDGNNMLGLLANTKLENLSTKINSLYLGQIMGFTRCTGGISHLETCPSDCSMHGVCPIEHVGEDVCDGNSWYEYSESEGKWVKETGVEARVADLTVDSVSHHGITKLNFTLSDVLTSEQLNNGIFGLAETGVIYEDDGTTVKYQAVDSVSQIPVIELADRISAGAETATYLELEHAGVVHLEDSVELGLDGIFGTKVVNGETIGVWEEWSINEIFVQLVQKATSQS